MAKKMVDECDSEDDMDNVLMVTCVCIQLWINNSSIISQLWRGLGWRSRQVYQLKTRYISVNNFYCIYDIVLRI